jgi:hypothetical protein
VFPKQVQEVRAVASDWSAQTVTPSRRPTPLDSATRLASQFSPYAPRYSVAEQAQTGLNVDVSNIVLPLLANGPAVISLSLSDITPVSSGVAPGWTEYTNFALQFNILPTVSQPTNRPVLIEVRVDEAQPNVLRVLFDSPFPASLFKNVSESVAGQNVSCSLLLDPSTIFYLGT